MDQTGQKLREGIILQEGILQSTRPVNVNLVARCVISSGCVLLAAGTRMRSARECSTAEVRQSNRNTFGQTETAAVISL